VRGLYSSEYEVLPTFRDGVPLFESKDECMRWANEHAQIGSNPEDQRLQHAFTHLIGWAQIERYVIPRLSELAPTRFPEEGESKFYKCHPGQNGADGDPGSPSGSPSDSPVGSPPGSPGDEAGGTDKPASASAAARSSSTGLNRVMSNEEFKPVVQELEKRFALKFHSAVNVASTINTLKYLYNHMRCGILIVIKDNRLALFAPFVNPEYQNNWGHNLRTDPPGHQEYWALKRKYYRAENIIPDRSMWWANGNIICNEHYSPRERFTHWWGDNLLIPFRHMLETLCRERRVPDVQLFFNKRDHPQLKADLTEPYDFCFDEPNRPLERERHESYAPIMSFYCSPKFADLPVPTTEDWESSVGKVFPPSFIPDNRSGRLSEPRDLYLQENFEKFYQPWEAKVNTAFFRGTATGGGTTPETNQRIAVAKLCEKWNSEQSNGDGVKLLDAGVTGFNVRDKKLVGQPMRFTRPRDIGLTKSKFVEMYRQGLYKYILYIDGHCAANRYSFLMRLGSVILKVQSICEASEMWFFPLLRPHVDGQPVGSGPEGADHVLIKPDLSDLREKLEWCRANDDLCRQIAKNAQEKYTRCLSRDAILDYVQVIMVKTAKSFEHAPSWYTDPVALEPRPVKERPRNPCSKDHANGGYLFCARCRREMEANNDHQAPPQRNRKRFRQ